MNLLNFVRHIRHPALLMGLRIQPQDECNGLAHGTHLGGHCYRDMKHALNYCVSLGAAER